MLRHKPYFIYEQKAAFTILKVVQRGINWLYQSSDSEGAGVGAVILISTLTDLM
jgi:hypothetical protein